MVLDQELIHFIAADISVLVTYRVQMALVARTTDPVAKTVKARSQSASPKHSTVALNVLLELN